MNKENWNELKERIKKKFPVLEEKLEDLIMQTADGSIKQGEQEILAVKTPAGKIRLACEIKPAVLEKRIHYTHRQGQAAQTDYKFSETEKTYKLKFYKWNEEEDEWQEINAENVGGMI